MKTYTFSDKNSEAVLIIDADNEKEALFRAKRILLYHEDFRMEEMEE
jgi:hypothetical protein